ncbi:MFS transporter [Kitasatospora sp. KL5]|uniref:MFS transporter n=1 Tax=Kitasatospora sp. KL5 TaxID=3425125 RepID=UPI003D6F5EEC
MADEVGAPRGGTAVAALLTCAMAFSMMQLFLLGALGPRLVGESGLSRTELGLTTTAGFGAAALLSPVAGRLVDRVGPRRCTVALLVLAAAALALIGAAPGPAVLLAAVTLGGLPQALANPATNKLILAVFPPQRRGAVTGWKQSGVQLGAFAAGLPLSLLAAGVGWRGAVWAARVLPADGPPAGAGAPVAAVPRTVGRLALFSLFLGCGVASVNTYLALFGTQRLGLSATLAAVPVAVLGLAGIAGRVGWSRTADRDGRAEALPALLALGAVGAALLLAAAVRLYPLVWPGAVAVGVFAVAANAVSMVLVIRSSPPGRAGRASALVSAGFFAGFAVGPPLFAQAVAAAGYGPGWLLVAAEFAAASAVTAAPALRRAKAVAA